MDQDNERLLDPDSNPDLEWWSDLSAPSDSEAQAQATPTPTPEPESAPDQSPLATNKAEEATTPPTSAPMPTSTPPTTADKAASAAIASGTPPQNSAPSTQNSKSDPPKENPQPGTRNSQPPKSAVIDRFEGKWAVLLVGEDEHVLNVPRSSLPKRVRAGHWLKIRQSEDDPENLVSAEIDPEATAAARARIADKLAKLRSGEYLK